MEKDLKKELSVEAKRYENLGEIVVANEEDATTYSEKLRQAKDFLKKADEKRKELTRPLDTSKKEIMSFFKELTKPADKAKDVLETALISYQENTENEELDQRQKAIKEEEEKIRKIEENTRLKSETKEKKIKEIQALINLRHAEIEKTVKSRSGLTIKTTKDVEVTDEEELALSVYQKYMTKGLTKEQFLGVLQISKPALKKIMIDSGIILGGAKVVEKKHTSL